MTLIAQYEDEGLIHAIPLRKTKTPPAIPDKTNMANKEATVFIQDIYEGDRVAQCTSWNREETSCAHL